MTPGKAGGLLGERLKGADKTVSRLKAAGLRSFPISGGRLGWGYKLLTASMLKFIPPPFPSTCNGEGMMSLNFNFALYNRRIGQTLVSPPA